MNRRMVSRWVSNRLARVRACPARTLWSVVGLSVRGQFVGGELVTAFGAGGGGDPVGFQQSVGHRLGPQLPGGVGLVDPP